MIASVVPATSQQHYHQRPKDYYDRELEQERIVDYEECLEQLDYLYTNYGKPKRQNEINIVSMYQSVIENRLASSEIPQIIELPGEKLYYRLLPDFKTYTPIFYNKDRKVKILDKFLSFTLTVGTSKLHRRSHKEIMIFLESKFESMLSWTSFPTNSYLKIFDCSCSGEPRINGLIRYIATKETKKSNRLKASNMAEDNSQIMGVIKSVDSYYSQPTFKEKQLIKLLETSLEIRDYINELKTKQLITGNDLIGDRNLILEGIPLYDLKEIPY